jgi:hypothetical protein
MIGIRASSVSDRRPARKGWLSRNLELTLFRAVYVFDISQTEGKELPTLTEVHGDMSGNLSRTGRVTR